MQELVPKHMQNCVSMTILDETPPDEDELKHRIQRHVKCCTDTEPDPSEAVAGVKKALAVRSELTAIGRGEGHWSALKEFLVENAGAECVFREPDRTFKGSRANIVTRAMIAGMTSPELKSKVQNILHMRGEWNEGQALA